MASMRHVEIITGSSKEMCSYLFKYCMILLWYFGAAGLGLLISTKLVVCKKR